MTSRPFLRYSVRVRLDGVVSHEPRVSTPLHAVPPGCHTASPLMRQLYGTVGNRLPLPDGQSLHPV